LTKKVSKLFFGPPLVPSNSITGLIGSKLVLDLIPTALLSDRKMFEILKIDFSNLMDRQRVLHAAFFIVQNIFY